MPSNQDALEVSAWTVMRLLCSRSLCLKGRVDILGSFTTWGEKRYLPVSPALENKHWVIMKWRIGIHLERQKPRWMRKILFTWPSLSRCLSDRWAVLHHYSETLQNRHRFPTLSTGRFQLVRLQGLGNQDLDTTTPRRSSIHWLPDFDPSETGQPVWLGRESENGSRWHSDLGSSSIYHPGNSENTLYNFRPLRGIRSGQQCTRWELE